MQKDPKDMVANIESWLKEAEAHKKAEVPSGDPGSTGTSHPVAKADGDTQPASTGARSAENKADVKSQVQLSVDSTGEAEKNRGDNTPALHIGVDSASTGEDPKSETASAKMTKDDPGTTHPAKASSYDALKSRGEGIMASIAMHAAKAAQVQTVKKAEETPVAPASSSAAPTPAPAAEPAPAAAATEPAVEPPAAAPAPAAEAEKTAAAKQAGAALADAAINAVGGVRMSGEQILSNLVKLAERHGDNVGQFLSGYTTKRAEGEDALPPAAMAPGMGASPDMAGGGMPPEMAGGMPPEAGAAGGGEEQQMMELVQALLAAGVTPEELLQLAQSAGGAGAGPEAGGMPPEAAAPAPAPEKSGGESEGSKADEKEDKAEEKKEAMLNALKKGAALLAKPGKGK